MMTLIIAALPLYAKILIPAGILFGLGALFAAMLAYLGKKFTVERDPRIEEINGLLSGANCGGCGFAGCSAFAEALVEGKADLSACSATSKENKDKIAAILGTENCCEDFVYIVACNGGNNCSDKYTYQGYGDCRSMELLASGSKSCPVGCMGKGSCVDACMRHAAVIDNNTGHADIKQDKCVKCGLCAAACPKGLIVKIPSSAKVYVACMSHEKGKDVRAVCKGGCIACGICAKSCPEGAITIIDNLAVIDYTKCIGCGICAEKCPSKCIIKR